MNISEKISDSLVKNAPLEVRRINDIQLKGFHVIFGKTNDNGSRSTKYYLYYRYQGKQYNFLLGSSDELNAKKARDRAIQHKAKVTAGINVHELKMKDRASAKYGKEVQAVFDSFYEHCKRTRKCPEEVKRVLDTPEVKKIANIPLTEFNECKFETRNLIRKMCLNPIRDNGTTTKLKKKRSKGSPVQANKTLSLLKQCFLFGVSEGLIHFNPLDDVRRSDVGGKERPKSRWLDKEEITVFFTWLNSNNRTDIKTKCAYLLLLLTGCRSGEMVQAKWKHIDLDKGMWFFPPENTKSHIGSEKPHYVPLTDQMKYTLDRLRERFPDSDYVFPQTRPTISNGEKSNELAHITNRSLAQFLRKKFDQHEGIIECKGFKLSKFTPHDFRRTFQTHIAKLGVRLEVCEKLLNHELQGVMRAYNQNDYMRERREALEQWNEKVMKWIHLPL